MDGPKRVAHLCEYCGQSFPGFPAHRAACDHRWLPHTRGSSACGYRHRPARRAHRLPPRRRPGRVRTAGVRRRPVRLRPAAPVSPPDPDCGGLRPADQSDAFGAWFATASVPPRQGPPRVRRPRRDRFGWLLSPWLLAPTAAVAVATTGVALWLWQTVPTGTAQARPGAAVTITVPAATGGQPGGPGRPLRVIPPLPPRITPVQATASRAAGTGDGAGGTPAPAGTTPAEPVPVTLGGPPDAPPPSPLPTAPAVLPATTAPQPGASATNAPPSAEQSSPPPEPVTTPPPLPVASPPPLPVASPPPLPVASPPPLPVATRRRPRAGPPPGRRTEVPADGPVLDGGAEMDLTSTAGSVPVGTSRPAWTGIVVARPSGCFSRW